MGVRAHSLAEERNRPQEVRALGTQLRIRRSAQVDFPYDAGLALSNDVIQFDHQRFIPALEQRRDALTNLRDVNRDRDLALAQFDRRARPLDQDLNDQQPPWEDDFQAVLLYLRRFPLISVIQLLRAAQDIAAGHVDFFAVFVKEGGGVAFPCG